MAFFGNQGGGSTGGGGGTGGFTDSLKIGLLLTDSTNFPSDNANLKINLAVADSNATQVDDLILKTGFTDINVAAIDTRNFLLKYWQTGSAGGTNAANANGSNDGVLATVQTAVAGSTTIVMGSEIGVNIPTLNVLNSPDSSGNNHPAYLVGTVRPTFVTSPFSSFGNAYQFDGVPRGADNNQGLDCGNIVTGVAGVGGVGVAAAFCLEAKIQTGSSIVLSGVYSIAGRLKSPTTGEYQPLLYISNNFFNIAFTNNLGVGVLLTSTTTLTLNTNYSLAGTYDGTTLRLFVNGVLESSVAVSGVETPDNIARFYIGKDGYAVANNAFSGIIDEVRWSKTARYTANYTPATVPFVTDANTLGLWHLDSESGAGFNALLRVYFKSVNTLITSTGTITLRSTNASFSDIVLFSNAAAAATVDNLIAPFARDLVALGITTLSQLQSLQIIYQTTDAAAGVTPHVMTIDAASVELNNLI